MPVDPCCRRLPAMMDMRHTPRHYILHGHSRYRSWKWVGWGPHWRSDVHTLHQLQQRYKLWSYGRQDWPGESINLSIMSLIKGRQTASLNHTIVIYTMVKGCRGLSSNSRTPRRQILVALVSKRLYISLGFTHRPRGDLFYTHFSRMLRCCRSPAFGQ